MALVLLIFFFKCGGENQQIIYKLEAIYIYIYKTTFHFNIFRVLGITVSPPEEEATKGNGKIHYDILNYRNTVT